MSSVSWTRVNELFLKAADLPPAQQSAYLDEACDGEAELRAEVEQLLAGDLHAQDESFLNPITNRSLNELEVSPTQGSARPDPLLGTQLGPYEIESLIGAGGMGRVYLAHRREGFAQQVAIKLLKRGMDSEELLRRFHNETHILAELGKHPNVSALLDAGLTDSDQPYLVMEYVDGERIEGYCRRHAPTITQRLVLFLGICDAVQYAHQRTVIHRDLKPSNILVTADGQPKLIDFGIAKITNADADNQNLTNTRTAMRVFTPNYASPEQAAGGQLTTASDVYSLGVLLYELLTGQRPYEITADSDSASRAIMATHPPRPSVAANASELAGDLDNIVQMAMRKEPERRYPTVADLAEDVRRHLTQFPVTARPETLAYLCSRFLRRHRIAAAAAAIVFISLTAGVLGTTWQWQRAERQASAAVAATEQAERAATESRKHEQAALRQVYRANLALAAADLERNNLTSARRRLDECSAAMRNWEWRYFDAEVRQRHHALFGHSQPPNSIVFYRDGSRLLTSSPDGTLRTWNLRTGKQISLHSYNGGSVKIKSCRGGGRFVALVPESSSESIAVWDLEAERIAAEIAAQASTAEVGGRGSLLATSSSTDHQICLWKMQDGSLLATLDEASEINLISVSQDGKRLAYTRGTEAVLWSIPKQQQIATLAHHAHPITEIAFSGNSERLVTSCQFRDGVNRYRSQLAVWDASDGKQVLDVSESQEESWLAKLNHSGDRIASAAGGSTIQLRDGETGKAVGLLSGHQDHITQFEFSPNDQYFASLAADKTIRLWNGRSGDLLTTFSGPAHLTSTLSFGPASRQLATCASDGSLRIWRINPNEENVLRGHEDYVYSACWIPGSDTVASASWDGTIRTWDASTRAETSRINAERVEPISEAPTPHYPNRVLSISSSPDGSRIAAILGDGSVHAWDLDAEQRLIAATHRVSPPKLRETWRAGIAFLSDSRRVAHQTAYRNAVLWNTEDNTHQTACNISSSPIHSIVANPALPDQIALGFVNSQVQIWQPGADQATAIYQLGAQINTLAYSKDGRWLAAGNNEHLVKVWDVASSTQIAELPHSTNVYAVAFTPDRSRLAVGCADSEIQIWDTDSWSLVAQLSGHEQYVHSLEFSEDGTKLLSASGDTTVRIWDASLPDQ